MQHMLPGPGTALRTPPVDVHSVGYIELRERCVPGATLCSRVRLHTGSSLPEFLCRWPAESERRCTGCMCPLCILVWLSTAAHAHATSFHYVLLDCQGWHHSHWHLWPPLP